MASPMPEPLEPALFPDGGSIHLTRIGRFQVALLPLGAAGWAGHGWRSALVFAVAGACSIAFWHTHRLIIARMLTPSVRRRWLYGSLVVLKLALIVVLLRGMIGFFPLEVIPLTTGILLFSASILLEACWLVLRPEVNENDLK